MFLPAALSLLFRALADINAERFRSFVRRSSSISLSIRCAAVGWSRVLLISHQCPLKEKGELSHTAGACFKDAIFRRINVDNPPKN